jgi:hypothetical protein
MSRDTATGGFPGILEFPNSVPLPRPRPADLGADNPQAPGAQATGPSSSSSNQPGGITGPLNPWITLKRFGGDLEDQYQRYVADKGPWAGC